MKQYYELSLKVVLSHMNSIKKSFSKILKTKHFFVFLPALDGIGSSIGISCKDIE